MSSEAQIQALLRKTEAEEQQLIQQRRSIALVVDARTAELRTVEDASSRKIEQLSELRGRGRHRYAREKNLEQMSAGAAFIGRLEQELKGLQPELLERRTEVERACQRLSALEAELKRVQLEKRQLEKLLANRQQEGLLVKEAEEEASLDEMSRIRERMRGQE